MSLITHDYSETQMSAMKRMLLSNTAKGKPTDYEIRLDGLPVVQRTNDASLFESYKKFMTPSTEYVNILLYEGSSRNNTKHMYRIRKEEPKQQWNPFMDLTPEQAKEFYLAHERRQWENDQLKREIESLTKKLERKETQSEEDERIIEKLEAQLRQREMKWGKVFSYALEGAVRRGIPFLANFKGAEGLKGLLEENGLVSESDTDSYFFSRRAKKRAEEKTKTAQPATNNASDNNIATLLEKEFDKEKKSAISSILVSLAKRPEDIAKAQAFLNKQKSKEQWWEKTKMLFRKVSDVYHSLIAWITGKYKLAAFFIRNIKHLKGML